MLISVIVLGVLALLDPLRPVVFVLVLRSNRLNATALLIGWAVALSALFATVFVLASAGSWAPATSAERAWAAAAEATLGAVLVILALRRWRRRGEEAAQDITPAAVLRRLDGLDRRKAGLMGVLIQPRAITVAAALVVARDRAGPVSLFVAFAVFALVSTSTLLGILGYHIWRPEEAERRLSDFVGRLEAYGPLLITALGAVAGGYLLVDGLLALIGS